MNFIVRVANRNLPPGENITKISQHPNSPSPRMSLDEAREVLEACAYGALSARNETHTKLARRILRACQTADAGTKLTIGPVTLELLQQVVVEN